MTQPTSDPGATPNPPAGATPAAAATPPTTTSTPTAEELQAQLAEAQAQIRKLNKESEGRRKSLDQLEKEKAEREAAELSEAQKLQKRLAEVEAEKAKLAEQANARLVRAEVLAAASAEFAHPEDVYILVKDKVTVNDAGEIEGLKEALGELKKSRPTWLKTFKPSGVQPTNPGDNANGNGETEAQRRARVYGGAYNPFDPAFAKDHGGGVFATDNTAKTGS